MKIYNWKTLLFIMLIIISACSSKDDDPKPVGDRTVSAVTISDYNIDGNLDTKATLNFEYDDSKRISKLITSVGSSSDQDSEAAFEYNNQNLLTKVTFTRGDNNYESTVTYENEVIKSVTSPGGDFTFSFNRSNNTYTITNASAETLSATVDEEGNITRFNFPNNSLIYEYSYDLTKKYVLEKAQPTFNLAYFMATADFRALYLSRNVIVTGKVSPGTPLVYQIENTFEGDYLQNSVWQNASSGKKAAEIELTFKE